MDVRIAHKVRTVRYVKRVHKFILGENCKNEERLVRMKNSANDLMTECEQLNVDING